MTGREKSDAALGSNRYPGRKSKVILLPSSSLETREYATCHQGPKMGFSSVMLSNISDLTAGRQQPLAPSHSHRIEKIEMFPIEMLSVYSSYFLQAVYFIVILTLI